jgi:hypothetical protein
MMIKDATGKLRLVLKNDASVDDLAHDVGKLLRASHGA